jgi:hypothetical protein
LFGLGFARLKLIAPAVKDAENELIAPAVKDAKNDFDSWCNQERGEYSQTMAKKANYRVVLTLSPISLRVEVMG